MSTGHVVYLVLAHTDPEQFRRLRAALRDDPVVIHLDAKVGDPRPFLASDVAPVRDRLDVRWLGYTAVEATLRLLRTAVTEFPDAGRFCLLSGDSYPLRDASTIRDYFAQHDAVEFINIRPMPTPDKPLSRITHYWHEHDPRGGRSAKWFGRLHKLAPQPWRRNLGDLRPHAGSQWWAISRAAVDHVLAEVERRPEYVRLMRRTKVSDEHFFHALLGGACVLDLRPSFMYVDFRPAQPSPMVLSDIAHVDHWASLRLRETDAYGEHDLLFARKFRSGVSDELTEQIAARLWPLARQMSA
jgi:hypothetical protein